MQWDTFRWGSPLHRGRFSRTDLLYHGCSRPRVPFESSGIRWGLHSTVNEVVCVIRILGANAGPLCLKPACSSVRIRLFFGSTQPHLLSEIGSSSVRLRFVTSSLPSHVYCFCSRKTIKQVLAESVVFGSSSVRLRFDFGSTSVRLWFPSIRRAGGNRFLSFH